MGETAVSSVELVPDRVEAARYIEALAGSPDAVVTFQTFDDRADGKDKDPALNRVRHGTLATYWGELVNLNRRGAGVYVMVNEGDRKGRGAANVTALRAVFLDDDQGELEPAALLLTPSIVVRSKAGLHVYWRLVPGEPLESFTSTQEELADQYGTDASVKDLPRVLRLPGFLHLKDRADPFMVRVVSTSTAVYSIADVLPARRAEPLKKSHAATSSTPPRVRAVRPAGSFGLAVEAFNAANPWPDLPAHNRPGPCSICGDSKSFHEHPADSGRWACQSSDHPPGVGIRKAACHVGDALDLWAHARGLSRREVLVADGFLEAGRPINPASREATLRERTPAPETDSLASRWRSFTVDELAAPPPRQEWIWERAIPVRKVGSLAGGGGGGKTSTLVGLAVHRAIGATFLGRHVRQGGTVILTTEDDHDDYLRKLAAWRDYLPALDLQAVAGHVHLLDLAGFPYRLVERVRGGSYAVTLDVQALADLVKARAPGADLIVLETVSRLGGDESNEAQSMMIVAAEQLAAATGAAVLLVTHVSKAAAREKVSDAYAARGGSSLGDNGRYSLVLSPYDSETAADLIGLEVDPETAKRLVVLSLPKINGAPPQDPVVLERVSTSHGIVLRPYLNRTVPLTPGERRRRTGERLRQVVTEARSGGFVVTLNRLQNDLRPRVGLARSKIAGAVLDAITDGLLRHGAVVKGGGLSIEAGGAP